jgi:hypothetical protein
MFVHKSPLSRIIDQPLVIQIGDAAMVFSIDAAVLTVERHNQVVRKIPLPLYINDLVEISIDVGKIFLKEANPTSSLVIMVDVARSVPIAVQKGILS